MILFEKEYSDEGLIDLADDIQDAVFNDKIDLPADEHGFRRGIFKVKVVWEDKE